MGGEQTILSPTGQGNSYPVLPCDWDKLPGPLQLSDVQVIIDYSLVAFRWLQENFPGYVLWAQDTGTALAQVSHFLCANIYVILTFCTIGNIVEVPLSMIMI